MFSQRRRQASLRKHQTFSEAAKILPTISEHRESRKNATKDLTHVISKFTNNNSKEGLKYSEQLLRSAIAVIKAFSQTQNNFQQLFLELYAVIKRFTFAIDDTEIQELLKVYKVKEGFSFRRTCLLMERQLDNVMKEKNENLKQVTEKYDRLKSQYDRAKSQWGKESSFLKSEIERYQKLADIEYMRTLQAKVQTLKSSVGQLEIQTTKLSKQNDEFLKQIDYKDGMIHDQAYQIAKLKAELFDARAKIDDSQQYFDQMRDRFDELLVTLMGLREIISKVEQENMVLTSERVKMVNRAAVAFEELTPRPKYQQIFGVSFNQNGMSTSEIFRMLASKSEESTKSIIQVTKEKRRHQKLQEAEALRNKVVDEIIEAKKQMSKVRKF